jgi:hypothetical protein
MPLDNFSNEAIGLTSPATNAVVITPSDTTDLANVTRAIHVTGTSGLVAVTTQGMTTGTSVQIYVGQGSLFPIRVTRIWATGTTAAGILSMY